ncbi:MAG: hypothetical protein BA863_13910 [Desulfovibrio sp. S3730MH75]|nr:MAG: hypothetical protein BA863_13910 [Desulfovibrio sp. S3730MH75]
MKFLFSLFVAGTIVVSGVLAPVAQADDAGLVSAKCVSCHSMKRVCRALGKKDLAGWEKTNARMVKKGMTVTDAELANINKYLAGAKPDGPICQ